MTAEDAVSSLLKNLQPFIRKQAYRYGIAGHYRLDADELQCEAALLACQIVERYGDGQEAEYIFRRSLHNRYIDLWRLFKCREGEGYEVDLEQVYAEVGEDGFDRIYLEEKLEVIREMLGELAYEVLSELVFPSEETLNLAVREHVRSRHLTQVGQRNRIRKPTVTLQLVARSLRIPFSVIEGFLPSVQRVLGGAHAQP